MVQGMQVREQDSRSVALDWIRTKVTRKIQVISNAFSLFWLTGGALWLAKVDGIRSKEPLRAHRGAARSRDSD